MLSKLNSGKIEISRASEHISWELLTNILLGLQQASYLQSIFKVFFTIPWDLHNQHETTNLSLMLCPMDKYQIELDIA